MGVVRRNRAAAVVLAAVFLQGCAARTPSRDLGTTPPGTIVEVFYATDRRPAAEKEKTCPRGKRKAAGPLFGPKRAEGEQVDLGLFPIRIPPKHEPGKLLPFKARPHCLKDAGHPLYLAGPAQQDREAFRAALRERLAAASRKEILVFVHGYNFKFDEAVLWAAQLKQDLGFEGVQVLYSWPSVGKRFSYLTDSVNAEWSIPHLKAFLDDVYSQAQGAKVHLIAHSLGNRVLLRALHLLAIEQRSPEAAGPAPRFGQIILAAPDIDADIFRQMITPVLGMADRVTLYVSTKDRALGFIGWLFSYPRVGDAEQVAAVLPGVDTVDVTRVDTSPFRHNYFLENKRVLADIQQLLKDGAPPEKRAGLQRVQRKNQELWEMQPVR